MPNAVNGFFAQGCFSVKKKNKIRPGIPRFSVAEGGRNVL
jgi:hypothetical protein